MMILMFSVAGDSYGINVLDITEVLPTVTLKHFPGGPEYVAGLLNYRGQAVPVVDLTLLMTAQASRNRISSRIVIVDYHHAFTYEGEAHHLLGLMIEKITETMRVPDHAFTRSGVATHETPFLGDIAIHNGAMIQIVNVNKVLPESLKTLLFYEARDESVIDHGTAE